MPPFPQTFNNRRLRRDNQLERARSASVDFVDFVRLWCDHQAIARCRTRAPFAEAHNAATNTDLEMQAAPPRSRRRVAPTSGGIIPVIVDNTASPYAVLGFVMPGHSTPKSTIKNGIRSPGETPAHSGIAPARRAAGALSWEHPPFG